MSLVLSKDEQCNQSILHIAPRSCDQDHENDVFTFSAMQLMIISNTIKSHLKLDFSTVPSLLV